MSAAVLGLDCVDLDRKFLCAQGLCHCSAEIFGQWLPGPGGDVERVAEAAALQADEIGILVAVKDEGALILHGYSQLILARSDECWRRVRQLMLVADYASGQQDAQAK